MDAMYQEFFGLRDAPFELTPNPRFLFLSPQHREALSNLTYAVRARKGITLLLGQAGTGKTTIMRAFLLSNPDRGSRFVYLENPALTRTEFYHLLAARLNLPAQAGTSKSHFLLELDASIAARRGRDHRVVLVIDEAQALPLDLLEEVRLLSNVESETEKHVSIVLAGQPELGDRLEQPDFEALKQRTCLRCELAPFELPDTAAYIGGRLRIAGGDPAKIFTREAVTLVHQASQGIARTISVICDNAMVSAFAADVKPIGADIVREVCSDFHLRHPDAPPPGPAFATIAPQPAPTPPAPAAATSAVVPTPPPSRRGVLARFSNLLPRRGRMTTLAVHAQPPERV